MTGKLMFVPDTHVVVPKAPSIEMIDAGYIAASEHLPRRAHPISKIYMAMIEAAPPLATPPVLRWERVDDICSELYVGNKLIATVQQCIDGQWDNFMVEFEAYKSEEEARRAAEKALGLPIVEEA